MSDLRTPRRLQFVDIGSGDKTPGWVNGLEEVPSGERPRTLHPPRLPDKPRHPLSPVEEPEQRSRAVAIPVKSDPEPQQRPRVDTLIEQLAPRAEEEVASEIAKAVEEFRQQRSVQLQEAERELIELVTVIARRVLTHQVQLDPSLAVGLVREGLAALSDADRVQVRLGRFFAGGLTDVEDMLAQRGVEAEVVIDASLSPHGCSIETQLGQVDESLETRLDGILAALTDPEAEAAHGVEEKR